MENGRGVISLIVDGGAGDLVCFQSALRTPHGKIAIIGESQAVKEAVEKAGIGRMVEYLPAGTAPLPESIIIDATKYRKS